MLTDLKRMVIGSPIETARQTHERLSKKVALAVFSSDALSSVAYATEEILHILVLGGMIALSYSLPVALAIAVLLFVVSFSYRQTIKAYPHGGGSYIVAKDNLGVLPSLTAGAGLLVGYVLTVAVSLSAGVSAIVSAMPELDAYRVPMALAFVMLLTLANLRGLRESGLIFAFPTYAFVVSIFTIIGVGLFRYVTGTIEPVASEERVAELSTVVAGPSLLLLVKAFAAGCTALTGIEAISDGVPAFKKPEWVNARATLTVMAVLLTAMFLGISFLASQFQALPPEAGHPETVLSQIGRGVLGGRGVAYVALQAVTAMILILAANTAYADFPRLLSFLSRDGYLPRQFGSLGDRLVFSNGIIVLTVAAAVLMVMFNATVTALIPLYAGGVFVSFSLSQFGMVRRWLRLREPGWQQGMIVNGIGAVTTSSVAVIVIWQKFALGAWILLILIPLIILMFLAIHKHYVNAAQQLSLQGLVPPPPLRNTVIVPVSTLHRGTVNALKYAQAIAPGNVTAVHISMDPEQTRKVQERWAQWGGDVPLIVLDSPYRSLVRPLLNYIEEVDGRWDNDMVTVVLPEFVPAKWWHHLLHNQTSLMIKGALLFRKNKVVTSVPYRLEQ